MVFDPIANNNKAATSVSSSSPKLDADDKKTPKRGNSTKRVSDNLKRSIAKELTSPKDVGRSRSSSPSPRSTSGKSHKSSKDKKEKKKKKKKTVSDPSFHKRSVNVDDPAPNESFGTSPLNNESAHSETSMQKKKPKRRRSSKSSKKTMQDAMAAAASLKNSELMGSSEHTASTKTSEDTSSIQPSSDKSLVKKKKKPLEKTSSKKALKAIKSAQTSEGSSSEGEKSSSASSASKGSPAPVTRNRLLSFESIHGKSIHKPKTRRNQGNSENAGKTIGTLAPPPPPQAPSPKVTHATLASPPSASGRKTSVLKAKKEKQEQERRASMGKSTTTTALSQKKKEDYINEVMDLVNSDHKKKKPVASRVPFPESNDDESFVDPDECSSQSSSCSIVSDGSYEKDDLLSHASEHSDGRSFSNHGTRGGLDESNNPPFGEHSFTFDADHELSPTKTSPTRGLTDEIMAAEDSQRVDNFKDTLMEAMASSMSALHEVEEGESPQSSPAATKNKLPKKPLLKMLPPPTRSSTFPMRMVPKRAKSDITSLATGLSKNVIQVRLPGQRKMVTRQRSLTFNEKVRVKRIPCQAQICGGDTSELWFQPQEYDAIKRKTMALIRAVQDDQTGGVTYCTRGLERYFSVDAVQEKRNDAWDSVLDEQEAQRSNMESFNADRLSRVYSQTTQNSIQEAIQRGKLDEDAIARYTKKMRQTLRRSYSNAV